MCKEAVEFEGFHLVSLWLNEKAKKVSSGLHGDLGLNIILNPWILALSSNCLCVVFQSEHLELHCSQL